MPFRINDTSNHNIDETIHYQITRPQEEILDDGQGNFNISPLGFPLRDNSTDLAQNPTRITPKFFASYKNIMDASGGLTLVYTQSNETVESLSGIDSYVIKIANLSSAGTTATAVTIDPHGYTTGLTVSISNASDSKYNGDFSITVIDSTTFTYTIASGAVSPDISTAIKSTFTLSLDDVILLTSQDNPEENGYYQVKSTAWKKLSLTHSLATIIKGVTTSNLTLAYAGTPTIQHTVDTNGLTYDGTYAIMVTATENGFATGSQITIASANDANYNGTFEIEKLSAYSFRYRPSSAPSTSPDTSLTTTATYQTVDGDFVYVAAQTDTTENGIYIVRVLIPWELFGVFYVNDGTENDNVAGDYGILVDSNGDPLNHYRKGYSFEETADYLRAKLNTSIEFGKFKGSNKQFNEQGGLVQWLLSGRKVNVGGEGKDKEVFVDGFGLGQPEVARKDRTFGEVDPYNSNEIATKQAQIANTNRVALWGLTNHHSRALEGFYNKSPFVKDYPFTYNSEYNDGILDGGHLPANIDAERWRMTVTGTSSSTDTNVRPFTEDMLWYHRDNAYHNNITLDLSDSSVYGRHSMSVIQNLDTPDEVILLEQEFLDTDITVNASPTDDVITVPDGTQWVAGDYVQFVFPVGSTPPTGISENTTYIINTVSTNDLTLYEADGATPIDITAAGSGTFKIQRHAFDIYKNDRVVTSLDDIEGVTLNTGSEIIKKITTGTVTKYYWSPRKKESLSSIAAKGAWTPESLSYDAAGANGINIYLNGLETDYITFTHPTKLTAELLADLNNHNEMIPNTFDTSTVDVDTLTELFVDNSLVDYTDSVNKTEKIRSKKTFVHLPAPLDLADGTPFELDVSLPVVPDTDSFGYSTVGSLSGYRNYVTQPRVYVLGGYQEFECTDIAVTSLTQTLGTATITTTSDHGYFTSTFTVLNVNPFDTSDTLPNSIQVSNISDMSVGDVVRFKDGGILPPASPAIAENTDYIISNIVNDKIQLETTGGTPIDILALGTGTHSILIKKSVRIIIKGATPNEYNGEVDATIIDFDTITYSVDSGLSSPASGSIEIDRVISVSGSAGVEGLTERNNSAIFGAMPEVEFAEDGNIYHQSFTLDNIIGNGKVGTEEDKRVLLATVYPTSTNTFAWRMDNDPHVRMLQWSLLNVNAGGGSSSTGSFANVAYKRNKDIFDEFPTLFQDGSSNGLFSVYDNPLSYATEHLPEISYTQQQINGYVRIKFPEVLVPTSESDMLSDNDIITVGSFVYQAAEAYKDLISDFSAGRVRVESRDDDTNFETDALDYQHGYDSNHGSIDIPTSFYDTTAGQEFIVYNTTETPYASSVNADRWITKALHTPDYIVNAQGFTSQITNDVYNNTATSFKDHITDDYAVVGAERESSAGNRKIAGDLNPSVDATFEFSVGSEHKFIDFLINNSTSTVNLNDVRRRFWDSYYEIPESEDRQMQNAYQLNGLTESVENTVKFYGFNWIPFAKIFSTDNVAPSENSVNGIDDYATIIGGGYSEVDNTIDNYLLSNPIASRFKANGYTDSFVSLNTRDSNSDVEEFLRDYITGYSNRMPFRFYNSFRIVVHGTDSGMTGHSTNTALTYVNTASDIDRIFQYSVTDYLNEFGDTPPSALIGQYIDDHFTLDDSDLDSGNIVAEDYNSSWWYFENGDGTDANIKDLINVSGMSYIADRAFYQAKMKYNYTRIKMSFVFSTKLGRWLPLDYRQAPTSYLTPTFGAVALKQKEKSIVFAKSTGLNIEDYIPVEYDGVNTIDAATYPINPNTGTTELDYLWKYDACFQAGDVYKDAITNPYYLMEPVKLNRFCFPFLSDTLPYDSDGNLNTLLDSTVDKAGAEALRFTRMIEPNLASPDGINFVVPNNVHGGETGADNSLFLFQPNMWNVYWHIRPAVSAMGGTDIPSPTGRSGGEMADPVLNNMFCAPDPRNPSFFIPWHEDMATDWLGSAWLIINAALDSPETRDGYFEFDAEITDPTNNPERNSYYEINSETDKRP